MVNRFKSFGIRTTVAHLPPQRFYSLRIYLAGEFGLYQLKGCKFRLVISDGYRAQPNEFYSHNAISPILQASFQVR